MTTFKKLLLAIAACACASAQAAPLDIAGSAAMHKLVFEKHGEAIKNATGVEVKYSSSSSGKGLLALLEGKITVAGVGDTMPDALAGVKKMSASVKVPANLKFHEFFTDNIAPIVHRDNPVGSLTKAQVKGLFSGTITNWKEVGGPDLPVKPVVGPAGASTTDAFLKPILDGAKLSASANELRSASAMLSEVARDKGAIGSASLDVAEKASSIKVIAGTRVSRPLSFATVGDGPPEVAKLVVFLKSPAGQKLLTD
jgi:phosphate transport system substrate-binding protein